MCKEKKGGIKVIIVSQDKKRLVENLNLGISKSGEYNKNYVIYNTELGEELGEYETEERAKQILEDIADFCIINEIQNKIYRMPKE